MKLVMSTGREIDIFRIIKGGMLDYLHIYINSLTPADIYSIFNNNPEETNTMTVIQSLDGQEVTHVYRDYTYLYSVQKPFLTSPEGTWMVWMQRPEEVIIDGA